MKLSPPLSYPIQSMSVYQWETFFRNFFIVLFLFTYLEEKRMKTDKRIMRKSHEISNIVSVELCKYFTRLKHGKIENCSRKAEVEQWSQKKIEEKMWRILLCFTHRKVEKAEDKDISLARHRFDVRVRAEEERSNDKTLHFILHQRIFVLLLLESRANMR